MMKTFKSIEEVLDFAMQGEQEAIDLYSRLAEQSENSEMRDTFVQFAREEMGHKARLLKIKTEGIISDRAVSVIDMKISDYLSNITPGPNMDYREALILAMSKEKAAFKLYTRLAAEANFGELKNTFLSLAQEEARHKLRFELEYDDYVLRDN
jgi:rubrerythrin